VERRPRVDHRIADEIVVLDELALLHAERFLDAA